jgi:A/G-specific adenine glycosylase
MSHKSNYDVEGFDRLLLAWFDQHGRKSLPWQQNSAPYGIWISEIMLQQTRVETVIPYYQKFMARFPDCATLAKAELDEVMTNWAGLGYYARARNLHLAAKIIRDEHKNVFPSTLESVMALPGIGRSTAGAILAFSKNARYPILDGNVKRVLARFFAISGYPGSKKVENELWRLSDQLTPEDRVADYTQAIMDLGAMICTRKQPDCAACPLQHECVSLRQGDPESYPAPRPAVNRPLRHSRMLLLQNQNAEYLFVKRPPSGIWGGMWVLPELIDAKVTYQDWCDAELGLSVSPGKPLSIIRHSFTHFELDIQPIVCQVRHEITSFNDVVMDSTRYLWYNPLTDAPVGFPAVVHKIFKLLGTGATIQGTNNESNGRLCKTG